MAGAMRRIRDRVAQKMRSLREKVYVLRTHREIARRPVDPRISYPSYKSLDDFVDVSRLQSLDARITEFLTHRLATVKDENFYTGTLTRKLRAKRRPGSRILYLARSSRPHSYFDLDQPGVWNQTADAADLPELMDFIATLPFERTARMMIMYDASGSAVTAHRDHNAIGVCHEFVWFRTNLRKPFYLLDPRTGQKRYVESHTAWFDTVNQFHGADAAPGLSFSIRVDGSWSPEFRRRIPVTPDNLAATPSLWACAGDVRS